MMTVPCMVVVTVSGLGCYALIAPILHPPHPHPTLGQRVIVGGYGLGGLGWDGAGYEWNGAGMVLGNNEKLPGTALDATALLSASQWPPLLA